MYQKIEINDFIDFLKNNNKIYIIKGSKNSKFFGPLWLLVKDKGKTYSLGRGVLKDSFEFNEKFFINNQEKFFAGIDYQSLIKKYKKPYILEIDIIFVDKILVSVFELANYIYLN